MELIVVFSDNADVNQATLGASITIQLDGLRIDDDQDLIDLADTVINTAVCRKTVGLPQIGGGAIWLNSVAVGGGIRNIEL